jgi:hypothetical protein
MALDLKVVTPGIVTVIRKKAIIRIYFLVALIHPVIRLYSTKHALNPGI